MTDCRNLEQKDVTFWHNDVFDHPQYKYICKLSGEEVVPYYRCNKSCKYYEVESEHIKELKKTGVICEWKGKLLGYCINCLHSEDGSIIGKDGWLNCRKWGAANIDPYGFCYKWEEKALRNKV